MYLSVLDLSRRPVQEVLNQKIQPCGETVHVGYLELKTISQWKADGVYCEVLLNDGLNRNYNDLNVENAGAPALFMLGQPQLLKWGGIIPALQERSVLCNEKRVTEIVGPIALEMNEYLLVFNETPIDAAQAYQSVGVTAVEEALQADKKILAAQCKTNGRIASFWDTQHAIRTDYRLLGETKQLIYNTAVYAEDYISPKYIERKGEVEIARGGTLEVAQQYAKVGKISVLNFAHPFVPGGGVLQGRESQECTICRASNLYLALASRHTKVNAKVRIVDENSLVGNYPFLECDMQESIEKNWVATSTYYQKHLKQKQKNAPNNVVLASNRVIYSPNVTILKNEKRSEGFYWEDFYKASEDLMNQKGEAQYHIDVISCTAPFFSAKKYVLENTRLQHLLESRIKNIFEVAIENNVEVLVLGAWGCGAFHNPPEIVAKAFRAVLLRSRYAHAFEKVVFALPESAGKNRNLAMFQSVFCFD